MRNNPDEGQPRRRPKRVPQVLISSAHVMGADNVAEPEPPSHRQAQAARQPPHGKKRKVEVLDTPDSDPDTRTRLKKDFLKGKEGAVTPPAAAGPSHTDERREAADIEPHRDATVGLRKTTRTIASSQKALARDADSNSGRCLVTNDSEPVQVCHLVVQATNKEMLTKLEYVWGLEYRSFNVDTRYNMMHLSNDWHFLFDQAKWVLVPEFEVLEKLSKIYLKDKCTTSDMTEVFVKQRYRYYVLPAPTLQKPIYRRLDLNSAAHDTHFPPYPELGPLTSHIHPHFVVFNTGKKLANTPSSHVTEMIHTLGQIAPLSSKACTMVLTIHQLYAAWTKVQVSDHFSGTVGTSNRSNSRSEEGQDDRSQGGPPRRPGLRSATRPQGQGTHVLAGHYGGGRQRPLLPLQPPEDGDSSSVIDSTVVEDDDTWIKYIHKWREHGEGIAENLESYVPRDSCDEQLTAYIDEHSRTPPPPGAWDGWKPPSGDRKSRYLCASDRAQFSSNDWAVFKNDVDLTRPNRTRVTT